MTHPFSFVFYNTENFYDTIDDPKTMDDDFTPNGNRKWTLERFNDKVGKLTKVIGEIVKPDYPDVIGLAEIENKWVMESILDEMNRNGIRRYSFIHYDSPDERGSDVAIIYNTQTFAILESTPILVHLPGIEDRTRDILYIKGKTLNSEILHLFVVHFPSRNSGKEVSERRRYFVASELKNAICKIQDENPNENVLVVGDFNDTPDDNSIDEVLGAKKEFSSVVNHKLYNLLYPKFKKGLGTTYHKRWLLFDQFIVSGSMLLSDRIDCKPDYADIFNPPYLLHTDRNKQISPNRSYRGRFTGGYSDHLPIYLRIYLK